MVSVVTGNGLKDVANAIKSAGEPIHIAPDLDLMVEEFKSAASPWSKMRFFIENTDEPEKRRHSRLFSEKFSAAATFRLDFYAAIV